MNKHERYSKQKYDSIANNYDTSADGRFTAKFKGKMAELADVSDGDSVLDVGCGNGKLLSEISRKADVKAYGIDVSPNMIEVCRQRYKGIDFKTASGERLSFDDDSFDLLTICCVLHHINNPGKFFEEARRVLKVGGALIVGDPWFPFGAKQFAEHIVFPLLKAGDNLLFSHKKLKALFIRNGFTITEIYKKGSVQIIKGRKQ